MSRFAFFTLGLCLLVVIALVAAIAVGAQSQPLPPKGTFVGRVSPYDDRILQLDLEAIDEAYRKQVELLFSVWIKDDKGQPERATTGIQQARRAYILSRQAIEKRMRELQENKQ
jgi:hypothetical protein